MPSPNWAAFSSVRARSYLYRLPLFTRVTIVIITVFWLVGLQSAWDVRQWGALIPEEVSITAGELSRVRCVKERRRQLRSREAVGAACHQPGWGGMEEDKTRGKTLTADADLDRVS